MALCAVCVCIAACSKADNKQSADTTAAVAGKGDVAGDVGQHNMQRCREFMEKVFDKGDTAAIAEYMAADFVEHNPSPEQQPGIDGFKKMMVEFRAAYPDMKTNIEDIFASGDKVTVRYTMSGTNSGPFMGMPATNKKISIEGIDILRLEDGKAKEHWGQFDAMGMMTQLGLMKPPAEAPAK
jgi:steroid delta-isomerase-like uncharacterized protein